MGRKALTLEQRKHGSMSTYNKGCRCDSCDLRAKEYRAIRRQQIRNGTFARRKPLVHGKSSTYSAYGCRCKYCRIAEAMAKRKLRGTVIPYKPKGPYKKRQKQPMECRVCGIALIVHPLKACWRAI